MATNFRNQEVGYLENKILETFEERTEARNICNEEPFFNHCKISRMRIKISDSSLKMTTSCFFSEHVQKGEQVILFENAEPSAWIRDCTPL